MTSWEVMLLALGWVCIFEGFCPMVMPARWKKSIAEVARAPENAIRGIGLMLVVTGLAIVWFTGS